MNALVVPMAVIAVWAASDTSARQANLPLASAATPQGVSNATVGATSSAGIPLAANPLVPDAANLPNNCATLTHKQDAGELRKALIIGNGHYKSKPQLKGTIGASDRLSEQLLGLGFDAIVCHDLTGPGVKAAVKVMRGWVGSDPSSALALYFFSGHGSVTHTHSLFWGVDYRASEADLESDDDSTSVPAEADAVRTSLPVEQFVKSLSEKGYSSTGASIVILDMCRTGVAVNNMGAASSGGQAPIALGVPIGTLRPPLVFTKGQELG